MPLPEKANKKDLKEKRRFTTVNTTDFVTEAEIALRSLRFVQNRRGKLKAV
jgi:hypothetical protein